MATLGGGGGSKISPELLARLSDRGGQRTYAQGELLLREGESSTEVYILLAGELRAFTTDANGHELVFNVMTPGEFFGELSLDGGIRAGAGHEPDRPGAGGDTAGQGCGWLV